MNENQAICVLNFTNNDLFSKGIAYFYKDSNSTNLKLILQNISTEYGLLKGLHIHECGDVTDGCTSACDHYNPENTNHGSLYSKNRHYGDLGNIEIDKNGTCRIEIKDIPLDINYIVGRTLVLHASKDDLGEADKIYNNNPLVISKRILDSLDTDIYEFCTRVMDNHPLLSKELQEIITHDLVKLRKNKKDDELLYTVVHKCIKFIDTKCIESKKNGNSGSRIACGIIGYCKPKII